MASQFGGSTFYEYHKAFAARAAALLLNHGIKVDWASEAIICSALYLPATKRTPVLYIQ